MKNYFMGEEEIYLHHRKLDQGIQLSSVAFASFKIFPLMKVHQVDEI